jgi:hypothetical protein
MMEFSTFNVFVREVANGTMALSALLLIIIFARYVVRNRRDLRSSETTQVAAALLLLLCGHLIRATNSWITFSMISLGWDVQKWTEEAWIWFVVDGMLVIIGKAMMIYWFAPKYWRASMVYVGIPACVVIPALLAIIF